MTDIQAQRWKKRYLKLKAKNTPLNWEAITKDFEDHFKAHAPRQKTFAAEGARWLLEWLKIHGRG